MAIPRRQRRQQPADQLAELNFSLREDLETGMPVFERYDSLDAMRDAWDVMGEEILTEWIAAYPGSRPFGWWMFTHNQERPVTGKWGTPEIIARHRAESRFGFLHTSAWAGEPLQQPEWMYLHLAGLLTDDELSRLPVFDASLPIYKQMGRFKLADVPSVQPVSFKRNPT
jgi:hypothetical protein